jgi:hypothetical protein
MIRWLYPWYAMDQSLGLPFRWEEEKFCLYQESKLDSSIGSIRFNPQ